MYKKKGLDVKILQRQFNINVLLKIFKTNSLVISPCGRQDPRTRRSFEYAKENQIIC